MRPATFEPLLRKLSSVDILSENEREAAMLLCRSTRVVERRRDICAEGDRPTHAHVIVSGWAARYDTLRNGERAITAVLLPGDFCDIHGPALERVDHSLLAITECRVASVTAEQIYAITRSTPTLTLALWRSTLIDAAMLRKWLAFVGRADAYTKLAHMICELHIRLQLIGLATDDAMAIPLTQADLADMCGLTSVHVNRQMQQLRRDELIVTDGKLLRFPDVKRLRHAGQFDPAYLHLPPDKTAAAHQAHRARASGPP